MKLKIGKIKFAVTVPFCILISFLLIIDKTGYMSLSLSAVAIHELAHLSAMNILRCPPREITASLKGVIIVGGPQALPREELAVLLAGPFSNLFCAAALFAVGQASGSNTALSAGFVQLFVGAFNLLPISGLDGGSVLLTALKIKTAPDKAEVIAKLTSIIFSSAVLFTGVSVLFVSRTNLTLLFLGVYLFLLNIPTFNK